MRQQTQSSKAASGFFKNKRTGVVVNRNDHEYELVKAQRARSREVDEIKSTIQLLTKRIDELEAILKANNLV